MAGSVCDGCGVRGGAMRKVSLGHDFFGAVYDRLTPASDRTPAWYCSACTEGKSMQLDVRAITAAVDALEAGGESALVDRETYQRAVQRLTEIGGHVGPETARFVTRDQVDDLARRVANTDR